MNGNNTITANNLKKCGIEKCADALGAFVGLIPAFGSVAQYIVGQLPYDHQIDRVVETLRYLKEKIENLPHGIIEKFKEPENLELLNEVLIEAGRTKEEIKRKKLADIFVFCVSDNEIEDSKKEKIFALVCELSQPEIIWLENYRLMKNGSPEIRSAFVMKHSLILNPLMTASQSFGTDLTQTPKNNSDLAWRQFYDANLARHGLIILKNYPITTPDNPSAGEITEFGKIFLEAIKSGEQFI